jgi:hypothetical protein
LTHPAINAVNPRLEGIGIPVKYFTDPDPPFGINATVALNRANRARPQLAKKRREMMSSAERRPRVYASVAGATPNEIWGKRGREQERGSVKRQGFVNATSQGVLTNAV